MQQTIQDLQATQASQVNLDVLCNSIELLKSKIGTSIKSVRFLKGDTTLIRLQYKGFGVDFCVVETEARREWFPENSYDKNYFCSFVYYGTSTEHALDDGRLVKTFNKDRQETFFNESVVIDIPTYELFYNMAWLCISSYKPLTGELLCLGGVATIPAGVGALCTLGEFQTETTSVKALEYLEPTDTDIQICGSARIVLIKPGQFVNQPPM